MSPQSSRLLRRKRRVALSLIGLVLCLALMSTVGSGCFSPLEPLCNNDNQCPKGMYCVNGGCDCPPNTSLCGNACVLLTSNNEHCGSCFSRCQNQQLCVNGACATGPPPGCNAPKTQCGTACVDTKSNAQHCGQCNNSCPTGKSCCQGFCSDQPNPQPETCNDADDDCDGQIDEGIECGCTNGQTRPCYTGPPTTQDVGTCKAGIQKCNAKVWQQCESEVVPQSPDCEGKLDKDCDGKIDPRCANDPWNRTINGKVDLYGNGIIADSLGNSYIIGYGSDAIKVGTTTYKPEGNNRLFLLKLDQDGVPQWITAAGQHNQDFSVGMMSFAANGDLIVSGSFSGTLSWPNHQLVSLGGFGAYLARIQPDGKVRWVTSVDAAKNEQGRGHAIDAAGNIYLSGSFDGNLKVGKQTFKHSGGRDIFLTQFNADGDAQWTAVLQSKDNDHVLPPKLDPTKKAGIFLAGTLGAEMLCAGQPIAPIGSKDVFLARFDLNGKCEWLRSVGGSQEERITGFHVSSIGATLAGTFRATAAFGSQNITSVDDDDIFISRFALDGNIKWTRAAKSRGDTKVWAVDFNDDGRTFLFGTYNDTLTLEGQELKTDTGWAAFVASLKSDGKPLWLKQLKRLNNGNIQPLHLKADEQGRVTFGGSFSGRVDFVGKPHESKGLVDIFIVHLKADGQTSWVLPLGSPGSEWLGGIFAGTQGHIYATGGYGPGTELDGKKLPHEGNRDLFAIKRIP